ncbi:MAG: hypothetical protein GYA24_22760 [Candidatus Lokiarchaeota archaeon]|nr:hypothetical protein [Candidatus Lokiarchaeota archaeon]
MGYDIYGVFYVLHLEDYEIRIRPLRKDLHKIVGVFKDVGIITLDEQVRLDGIIDTFKEGDNRNHIDSEKLLFTDEQLDLSLPITIPYHIRSESAFPMFHSKNIIDGKWGETSAKLEQHFEIYCYEKHVAPMYAIPDETCLYLARVHYEGNLDGIERIYRTNKTLVNLRKRLDTALGVPSGTVRMNLVAC